MSCLTANLITSAKLSVTLLWLLKQSRAVSSPNLSISHNVIGKDNSQDSFNESLVFLSKNSRQILDCILLISASLNEIFGWILFSNLLWWAFEACSANDQSIPVSIRSWKPF